MSSTCWEIVVYRVAEEKFDEFLGIRDEIYDSLRKQPGFISAETFSSVRQRETLVDMLQWETPEDAVRAFEQFKSIPSAKDFMATIRQVLFSDHVQVLKGA
jgi:hypothetical protein